MSKIIEAKTVGGLEDVTQHPEKNGYNIFVNAKNKENPRILINAPAGGIMEIAEVEGNPAQLVIIVPADKVILALGTLEIAKQMIGVRGMNRSDVVGKLSGQGLVLPGRPS